MHFFGGWRRERKEGEKIMNGGGCLEDRWRGTGRGMKQKNGWSELIVKIRVYPSVSAGIIN
jgi:hypothetical protein